LVDEFSDGEGGAAVEQADGDEEEVCDRVLVAEDDEGPDWDPDCVDFGDEFDGAETEEECELGGGVSQRGIEI